MQINLQTNKDRIDKGVILALGDTFFKCQSFYATYAVSLHNSLSPSDIYEPVFSAV